MTPWKISEQGSLTAAQRMTLNARIPRNQGTIAPDGNLIATAIRAAPMTLAEAKEALDSVLVQSDRISGRSNPISGTGSRKATA